MRSYTRDGKMEASIHIVTHFSLIFKNQVVSILYNDSTAMESTKNIIQRQGGKRIKLLSVCVLLSVTHSTNGYTNKYPTYKRFFFP